MTRNTYSLSQRLLHWSVALLVLFNLLLPDGMNAWHHMIRRGQTPTEADISRANIHAYVGIAILALAALRVGLRIVQGVPPAPPGQPQLMHQLAAFTHGLLYALLFAMPLSGIAAYYFGYTAVGSLHGGILKILLWAVIGLHAAGALAQHLYFRTDVLRRMTFG